MNMTEEHNDQQNALEEEYNDQSYAEHPDMEHEEQQTITNGCWHI